MPSKKKRTKQAVQSISLSSDKENGTFPDPEPLGDAASTSSEDEDDEGSSNVGSTKEIEVEFEAWPILDSDYDAIKAFLQQTFQTENVNLSEITESIIAQNYIGCIYKPSLVNNEEDQEKPDEKSDSETEMDKLAKSASEMEIDDDDIYGVMTSLNLGKLKDKEFICQLRHLLSKKCRNANVWKRFDDVWSDPAASLGWIISERFVNIPYQISLPSFESLISDITKSCRDDPSNKFTHYLLLSKCHKMPLPRLGKSKSPKPPVATSESDVIFSNPEDEFFIEHSLVNFEYKAKKKSDKSLVAGKPDDECELEPWRKVVLMGEEGFNLAVAALKKDIEG